MAYTYTNYLCRNCLLKIHEFQALSGYKVTETHYTDQVMWKCYNCGQVEDCTNVKLEFEKKVREK